MIMFKVLIIFQRYKGEKKQQFSSLQRVLTERSNQSELASGVSIVIRANIRCRIDQVYFGKIIADFTVRIEGTYGVLEVIQK